MDFMPDFSLIEDQLAPSDITREDVLNRLTACGGERRTVDGQERIYVFRIAWDIMGYNHDTHILIDRKLTDKEVQELMNATLGIYFDTGTDTFVCPSPEGKDAAELVDDTLKITEDLEYIRNKK